VTIVASEPAPSADAVAPGSNRWPAGVAVVGTIVGVVLWLWPRGPLWLDEAQSVAIARRSPAGIVDGLRADGAPPLYYGLLHAWMWLVGDGDRAVRALSAVAAVAAVVLTSIAARRIAGVAAGWVALALMAVHPFVVRYASETRMYTLVMAEVAGGIVLTEELLRTRRRGVWLGLALCSLALVWTHYWSLSVLAAALALGVAAHVRGAMTGRWESRQWSAPLLVATAIAAGLLASSPWWPIIRFQSTHTGTPWTRPPSPWEALRVVVHWTHTSSWLAAAAMAGGVVLLIAGSVASRASAADHDSPALTRRALSAHLWLSAVLVFAIAHATRSAFVSRYTAVLFPSTIVLISAAVVRVRSRPLRWGLLGLLVTGGVLAGVAEIGVPRTRAATFADVIRAEALPGDLVVDCPDQLGPALWRTLGGSGPAQIVFPTGASAERVDWIDYRARYESAAVAAFVDSRVVPVAPPAIWLVLSETYPPTQAACTALFAELQVRYGPAVQVIADDPGWRDHDQLWRFVP
jgi:hypothetical protein